MTRDEANRKAQKAWVEGTSEDAGPSMVNVFVALGMLKLDESVSAEEKFKEAIYRLASQDRHARGLLQAIETAGLKIVEK